MQNFSDICLYCIYPLLQEILREEIKILEEKVEHHPDVTKYAMENLELRGLKTNNIKC